MDCPGYVYTFHVVFVNFIAFGSRKAIVYFISGDKGWPVGSPDKIRYGQKVKVPNVVLQKVCSKEQIPDDDAVSWGLNLKSVLQGEAAGKAVSGRAYAAYALG